MSNRAVHPARAQAIEAVQQAVTMLPDDAREYLEMLGCAAIHVMRAQFGDDYARGWVEHALSDFDRPPLIELRKPQ